MSAVPDRLTVLQVLPSLQAGGVERGTVEMVQAVARAGGDPLVASAGGRLVVAVQRAGGRHVTLPLAAKNPVAILRNAARLTRLIAAERPAIVHARSRAPAWSAFLACRRTGTPFVTTYHGAYAEDLPGKRRYNAVMAKGDRVIAISEYIAELVQARHGVGPDRLRVIPRGVDADLFNPDRVAHPRFHALAQAWRLPDGAPVILLPARLTRWKGQTVLLDALRLLQRRDAIAVLVGGGKPAFARELAVRAERLGVASRLRLAGHVDDMPAALMLADVVVHASIDPEPFGRAVIEAQAMCRPVIAADAGGAVETVRHGETGWRIAPDDPRALAAALDVALGLSAEARAALGARARAAVQAKFSTAAMQDATLAVYNELL